MECGLSDKSAVTTWLKLNLYLDIVYSCYLSSYQPKSDYQSKYWCLSRPKHQK